jgi:hypothetical protein
MEGQKFKVEIKVISDVVCPWCVCEISRLSPEVFLFRFLFNFNSLVLLINCILKFSGGRV